MGTVPISERRFSAASASRREERAHISRRHQHGEARDPEPEGRRNGEVVRDAGERQQRAEGEAVSDCRPRRKPRGDPAASHAAEDPAENVPGNLQAQSLPQVSNSVVPPVGWSGNRLAPRLGRRSRASGPSEPEPLYSSRTQRTEDHDERQQAPNPFIGSPAGPPRSGESSRIRFRAAHRRHART